MNCDEVFCCGEQVFCVNNRSGYSVCFKHISLLPGEKLIHDGLNGICWVFVLDGEISVIGQVKEKENVGKGEMVLLSSFTKFHSVCGEAADLMVFTSDHPKEYSAALLDKLKEGCEKTTYRLNKLPIRNSLDIFLRLLVGYLKIGMVCEYLYEEKQEELFILMSHYYTISELKTFLYPYVMQKDMDFKKIVLLNSVKARSVQELVEMCGYTMGGFKKIFKEMFDEPIYQWMLQQKADKLRHKLVEDDINLKSLIDEFGFSSPAHFTKFCKKWLEKTPTQFIESVKTQREQLNL